MTDEVQKWIQRENLIQRNDVVIVGLSGGADSVCLLLVLAKLQEKLEFLLQAVHVEHGIRGEESLADAAFVEDLCRQKKICCQTFHKNVPLYAQQKGLGLEEAARILRYQCYQEAAETLWNDTHHPVKVALAHHADDNAETVLFQMVRGSGIRGLGGIRSIRQFTEHASIIRPLLNRTRKDIEAYLGEQEQSYRLDGTNMDTDYSRNRIRHEVLPQLECINEQAVFHIVQSAQMLQEVSDYLETQVQKLLEEVCQKQSDGYLLRQKLFCEPPVVLGEVIIEALARIAGSRKDIGSAHVEAVRELASLQVGRSLTLPYGMRASRVYEGILIGKEVKMQSMKTETFDITEEMLESIDSGEYLSITLPQAQISFRVLDFQGKMQEIQKKKYTKWLDYDNIKHGLQIRKRAAGDYLVIDEQGHRKKLKEYFVEEKIPASIRNEVWLVTEESHVLWVVGGRIGADYKIHKNTGRILEIQITGGNYHED